MKKRSGYIEIEYNQEIVDKYPEGTHVILVCHVTKRPLEAEPYLHEKALAVVTSSHKQKLKRDLVSVPVGKIKECAFVCAVTTCVLCEQKLRKPYNLFTGNPVARWWIFYRKLFLHACRRQQRRNQAAARSGTFPR